MKHTTKDTAGLYRTGHDDVERQLRFDRGTLLLEGIAELPAGLETWFCYDPRVDAYRAPAHRYGEIIGPLKGQLARNKAPRYQRRELACALEMTPYPHQQEALAAWRAAKGRGVVVLPTGAGKTLVGLLALCWARRDGLIMVPTLIGPIVYRRRPEQLAGDVLADFQVRPVHVDLSPAERSAYQQALDERNAFLQANRLGLNTLEGWNRFVMLSARSVEGRRAMRAHRAARRIAHATPAKLRALGMILANHPGARTVIFTEDNATAYEVSQRFLIPCLTHQTAIKERQDILDRFKSGAYAAIVTSNVLNEGVDVPDASVGVILSGSASAREFVQRLGRILRRGDGKQAVLYEVIARETREERVADRRRDSVHGRHRRHGKEEKDGMIEKSKEPVFQQSLWDSNQS
ncbi:MAG: yejH [Proteobacteria bacterium]|nr:yejH [Pseudomonadota bacterium]